MTDKGTTNGPTGDASRQTGAGRYLARLSIWWRAAWRDGETWWWAAVLVLAINPPLADFIWFREYGTSGAMLAFPLAMFVALGLAALRGGRWIHALLFRGGKRAAARGRGVADALLAAWLSGAGAGCLLALLYRPASTRVLVLAGAAGMCWIMATRRWWRVAAVVAFPVILSAAYRLSYVTVQWQASTATWLAVLAALAWWWRRRGRGEVANLPIRSLARATAVVLTVVLVAYFFRVVDFNEQRGKYPDESTPVRIVYGPPHPMWDELPRHEVYDVKVDEQSQRLYLADRGAGRIGRIDLRTHEFILSEPVYPQIEQLVLRDDGRFLATYLNPRVGSKGNDALWIDTETLQVTQRCHGIRHYVDMVASLTGDIVIAAQEFNRDLQLVVFNQCREKQIRTATRWPYQVLCSPKWSACFVSGQFFSATLSRARFRDGVPDGVDALFVGPFSLGMTKDETRDLLFVARPLLGVVDVIDAKGLRRVRRIRQAPMVRGLAAAPEADLLFAPDFFTGDVAVFRLSTGEKLGVVPTSRNVREVVWSPKLRRLFVAAEECVYSIALSDLAIALPAVVTTTEAETAAD